MALRRRRRASVCAGSSLPQQGGASLSANNDNDSAEAAADVHIMMDDARSPRLLDKAKSPDEEITEDSQYDSDGIEVDSDDESDISGDDYDHHVECALDSLWENDMLEVVPVAPGQRSLNEESLCTLPLKY